MSESTVWLTQAQAAERIGVTPRTVREYIRRGILPAHRVKQSHIVRIKPSELDAIFAPIPNAKSGGGDA